MPPKSALTPNAKEQHQLIWLDWVSDFMDSKFRIPFTNIRFGADALMGLFPYAGDIIGFAISSILIITMVHHGASGKDIFKMLGNIILDTLVGAIPLLGDLFDLTFKANRRNFNLLKEHYQEGKHQGNAWWVILLIFGVLIGLLVLVFFISVKVVQWLDMMARG